MASTEVIVSGSGELVSGATAAEQLTPGQGGDVGGPVLLAASDTAEEVLGGGGGLR